MVRKSKIVKKRKSVSIKSIVGRPALKNIVSGSILLKPRIPKRKKISGLKKIKRKL